MKAYFTSAFNAFFRELAPNNNKEWFDANRGRYEAHVKEPFRTFTEDLIQQISKLDPKIRISAKDAVFRINRDIRFSKDKYPYKMHMAAAVSHIGKKAPDVCGFYYQFNPEGIQIWHGAYFIEPATLGELRYYLADHAAEFNKLMKAKKFTTLYGEVVGEGNSRLPKDLKSAAEKQPLLLHKNFYWGAQLPPKMITSKELLPTLMEYYKAGKALAAFLDKGMKG